MMTDSPKVALVHDYLIEYGGAERVLEALHELFPTAPVFVSFVDSKRLGPAWQKFAGWDIRQTSMARLPFIKKLHSPYRIFAPGAFARLDLSGYDLVISSSNAYFSKAVRVPNGVHYCYCHTPPRALYGYTTGSNWREHSLTRWAGEIINHFLRIIDFEVSRERVHRFIANSHETARRIATFYRRDSVVIYPPVVVPKKLPVAPEKKYFLYLSRLAFAKHPELAVRVATQLSLPLVVAGTGPSLPYLKKIAGPTVTFLGFVSDEQLPELYQGARALLYPVEDEDFGIVPVEAMGHGVPVIAHNSGGPRETVQHGKTGVLFDELSTAGLAGAIEKFEKIQEKTPFDPEFLHTHALGFSAERFKKEILQLLTS